MAGVDNIKKVLSFVIGITKDIVKAQEDGKFSFKDLPLFVDDAFKIPAVIRAATEVYDEYVDLDAEESAALKEWAKGEFDWPDEKVEELIEAAFDTAIDAAQLVEDVLVLAAKIKALK